MLGKKLGKSLLATAAVGALATALGAPMATAATIDNWNLNLDAAEGVGGYTGLTDVTGVDRFNLTGSSEVIQALGAMNNLGQPFTDSGHLQISGYFLENPPPAGVQAIQIHTGFSYNLYFRFDGLTGTVTSTDGDIGFTANTGTIALWLDDDLSDFDPTTGGTGTNGALKLADFKLVGGGGQGLDFFGGATPTGTLQVTLEQTAENASLTGDLFTDENDAKLLFAQTFHLGDMTAELTTGVGTNPAVGVPEAGKATAQITNNGSYNVTDLEGPDLPEPSTMAALGFGLLGIGGLTARRRRKSS